MHHHALLRSALAPAPAFARAGRPPHAAPDLGLESEHLHITLDLLLHERTLVGRVATRFRARRDGVCRVTLDAVAFEDVAVRVDGAARPFAYDGRRLRIELDPLARGEDVTVTVDYRVVDPPTGLLFSVPDEVSPERPLFAATDSETERARYWLPCIDHSLVRPTLSWEITAPSHLTVLANGTTEERTELGDGRARHAFALDHPCPSYLTCFAVGEFVRWDGEPWQGREVAAFTTPRFTEDDLRRSFDRTTEMITWLGERLGVPFPWPKYHQFAVPGIGGAMENISLVSWDDRFVLPEALLPELKRLVDQVNLHELAHTWFGDLVVCRDYTHVWLKESWATFMEQVWFEECVSREEADWELLCNARSYFAECDTRYRRPIVTSTFDHSWDLFDMHLYPGGACRLHMLRSMLGADDFWRATARYLRENRHGVVETDTFRRTLEDETGRSLTRFFEQFFYAPGFPELTVGFAWDETRGEGTWTITQTQEELKAGRLPFEFDVVVAWDADGAWHERTVRVDATRTIATFAMKDEPTRVRFDPRTDVLARVKYELSEPLLRAQLEDSPDVIGRVLAGEHLIELGTRSALKAVEKALAAEPFWGVRRALGAALVESLHGRAMKIARRWVEREEDPRALEGGLTAGLGVPSDKKLLGVVAERLERGLAPRAHAAALRLLAAGRAIERDTLLQTLTETEETHGILVGGAADGLARMRKAGAARALARRCDPRLIADNARPAVLRALGSCLRWLRTTKDRELVLDALVGALREPPGPARDAALVALATSGERGAIGPLERVRATIPEQYLPRFDARLDALRAEVARTSGDTKRIEKLERAVRSLRDTVQTLEARSPGAS